LIILFETQLVPRFSGASPARAANLVALVRGGGRGGGTQQDRPRLYAGPCRANARCSEPQRRTQAQQGGAHTGEEGSVPS
jgi:hypothetical protein